MAQWQVVADRITLYPHPNADALELGRVGFFQVVVAKSNGYQEGDIVFFAPERSILPEDLRPHYTNSETGISYLTGPEHDRVHRVRLRGQYSEGVTINRGWALAKLGLSDIGDVSLDVDLSKALGIIKYEAPIPPHLAGAVDPINIPHWRDHDVEPWGIHQEELREGEPIIVTEKLHGSQVVLHVDRDGTESVTSKGLGADHLQLRRSETNFYWRAIQYSGLGEILRSAYPGQSAQVFGEVFPLQKGFAYGATHPTLRIFRLVVEGREVPLDDVPGSLIAWWVPLLYRGRFHRDSIAALAKGLEQVSGKGQHIREGIVVAPDVPRRAQQGFPLYLKIINPKFKDSEEFVS